MSWCAARNMDPISSSAEAVLKFLQDGFRKGLRPATLKRQVAALDSVYSLKVHAFPSLSRHPIVQKFLRGATLLCPAVLHRFPTWHLNTVLRALTGPPFKPMGEVDLKWVRLKLIFLVAITSACRVLELSALSCRDDLCVFHRDKVVLRMDPTFKPKVASPLHMGLEINLPSFCSHPRHPQERKWHTLDVRRALKFFLWRTEHIHNTDRLLVNISPPRLGDKMSPLAISGAWIAAPVRNHGPLYSKRGHIGCLLQPSLRRRNM